jgi:beta-galactosidase
VWSTTTSSTCPTPWPTCPASACSSRCRLASASCAGSAAGPHENYPDRAASATLGIWHASPDASPYLVPQEFGLRTDCRWFDCIDPRSGDVVRVQVLQPSAQHVAALHCSATHSTADDLYRATTATELTPRRELVVHLDAAHRGLGTASCGPDVLPQYRLAAGRYRFAYRLSLLRTQPATSRK